MSGHKDHSKEKSTNWLDDKASPKIQDYTMRLTSFLEAMADGVVDHQELKQQEERLVALMKKVEPQLSGELHEDVTALLCELTAYNIMQTTHELDVARHKTKFRG